MNKHLRLKLLLLIVIILLFLFPPWFCYGNILENLEAIDSGSLFAGFRLLFSNVPFETFDIGFGYQMEPVSCHISPVLFGIELLAISLLTWFAYGKREKEK